MGQTPSSYPAEAPPSNATQLESLPSITSVLTESCSYPDFTPVDLVPTLPSDSIADFECPPESHPATSPSDSHSRLREELRRRLSSNEQPLDWTNDNFDKHPWFPKPRQFKPTKPLSSTPQAFNLSNLDPSELLPTPDASTHTTSIHKMVDALYQPFRKILPFSLLSQVAWLLAFRELYPVASPEFLIFEIDFLTRDIAGFAETFGFTKPCQALFFSILELIRLVILSSHKDVDWKSIDSSLLYALVGWRHEVRKSKGITPRYIAKIQKYVLVELLPANLMRTMHGLGEWEHALTAKPRPSQSPIALPYPDRLEIFYVMSGNGSKSHVHVMEQIIAVYVPTLVTNSTYNALHVIQKLMYLMRHFVSLLALSPDCHKSSRRTKMFLEAMGDITELAVTVLSVIGPRTSASELLWMVEVMDEIDAKLAKTGFEQGVFVKAKIKIMSWCCKQEWFERALGERHPEWAELGQPDV